jgi:hypothetical protein
VFLFLMISSDQFEFQICLMINTFTESTPLVVFNGRIGERGVEFWDVRWA